VKLLYLSRSRYGGWVTFTTHLYHGLVGKSPTSHDRFQESEDHEVIRMTNRTEGTYRDMGNFVPYKNISDEDILELEGPILITALDKHHREVAMKLLEEGAHIVIHDPTELRNSEFRKAISPSQVIVIRKSMLKHMPKATFIPHPYMAVGTTDALNFKQWEKRKYHAISISRLDFDKNSHWLFEANRQLPPEKQIYIRGAENRMYTKNKILPKYPEYIQDSHRKEEDKALYKLDFRGAVNLCKTARFMADFSVIQGDGGGTQYTFLEAIDAGTICLLHREWIHPNDAMMDHGENQNCMSFENWEQMAKFLNGKIPSDTTTFLRTNAIKLLQKHNAVDIALDYVRIVQ
jgi:glycosyltransferase involved in cell wall biosynthesis